LEFEKELKNINKSRSESFVSRANALKFLVIKSFSKLGKIRAFINFVVISNKNPTRLFVKKQREFDIFQWLNY